MMGIPCVGLNGARRSAHRGVLVSGRDRRPSRNGPLWNAIVDNGGEESVCGWCKGKWGISWQITRRALAAAIADPDPATAKRALDAMMATTKIDIAAIEADRRG